MTITSEPWQHPDFPRIGLSLVQVHPALVHALAGGTVTPDEERTLSRYLLGGECAGLWRYRSDQITKAPGDAPRVTRIVRVIDSAIPVGLAGFHGPPDAVGMVEVGYRIDPAHRRKGHARHALETLLAVASAHPDVSVVRATISPDNVASRALVQSYGFAEVGEQWDEEDGLEVIFEVVASGPCPVRRSSTSPGPAA